jgi:hypothetical protein
VKKERNGNSGVRSESDGNSDRMLERPFCFLKSGPHKVMILSAKPRSGHCIMLIYPMAENKKGTGLNLSPRDCFSG